MKFSEILNHFESKIQEQNKKLLMEPNKRNQKVARGYILTSFHCLTIGSRKIMSKACIHLQHTIAWYAFCSLTEKMALGPP